MSQKGKIENKRDIRCYLFKKSLINKKISVAIFVVFVILAVNAFVFRNHYFNGYGFPWDFVGTYLAVPFYWIEAVKVGASLLGDISRNGVSIIYEFAVRLLLFT